MGQAETPDPPATALLILGYGSRTRDLESLTGLDKTYTGTIRMGETTPSFDGETEVDHRSPWEHLSEALIREVVGSFRGELSQRPPLYSAKHHKGERAYHLARQGATTLLDPVTIVVRSMEVVAIRGAEVDIKVSCAKGTYIRSLAHDIGQVLGCGAWLCALCRTRIGSYELTEARSPQAWSDFFDEVKAAGTTRP